jgi:hypothetical protein
MAYSRKSSAGVRVHKAKIAGGARHGMSANPVALKAATARGPIKGKQRGEG